MDDYCLFPNQCGPGFDCSGCMGLELKRRASRIAELEARLVAAERDRERYKLWRSKATISEICGAFSLDVGKWYDYPGHHEDAIDAAIDSARENSDANSK